MRLNVSHPFTLTRRSFLFFFFFFPGTCTRRALGFCTFFHATITAARISQESCGTNNNYYRTVMLLYLYLHTPQHTTSYTCRRLSVERKDVLRKGDANNKMRQVADWRKSFLKPGQSNVTSLVIIRWFGDGRDILRLVHGRIPLTCINLRYVMYLRKMFCFYSRRLGLLLWALYNRRRSFRIVFFFFCFCIKNTLILVIIQNKSM